MIQTDLVGKTVCLNTPPMTHNDGSTLHKTKAFIRGVYINNLGIPRLLVETHTQEIEYVELHQVIICWNVSFEDVVTRIEKDDAKNYPQPEEPK